MSLINSRDVILGKIRTALTKKTGKPVSKPDFSTNIFKTNTEDSSITFAENLIRTKAEFFFCENTEDFKSQLKELVIKRRYAPLGVWEKDLIKILPDIKFSSDPQNILSLETGITLCECMITRHGSVMISSKQTAGRRLGIFPPVHIVIGYSNQLVPEVKDGIKLIQGKYKDNFPSMVCLTTGPSRTADIEKKLVLGAHGPRELIVFFIDEAPAI